MARKTCVICATREAEACTKCGSYCYCSTECKRQDEASHELLCGQSRALCDRPSKNQHFRAIFFPKDSPNPKFIWFDPSQSFGPGKTFPDKITIRDNKRRQVTLPSLVALLYTAQGGSGTNFGSDTNLSVVRAVDNTGFLFSAWPGPCLTMGWDERPNPLRSDEGEWRHVDLADYRHVLDFFCYHGRQSIGFARPLGFGDSPQKKAGEVVECQISCLGQMKEGTNRVVSMAVSKSVWEGAPSGPLLFVDSPISLILGMPLKLARYPKPEMWDHVVNWEFVTLGQEPVGAPNNNGTAASMLMEMDGARKHDWGRVPQTKRQHAIGNVLKLVQPKAMHALQGGWGGFATQRLRKKKVLAYITRENMEACRADMDADPEWKA
ncbi:Uu.00g053510.m01.CDS01 [Anthostomella pinea]|uniref:Uu.00g053510.m01.CDS01 n=1 Tax=Anthostomella pinea TaxID=933095 RepID=A0AAI8YPN3_9PEZI|nr:Uu.00g053510.m01.CDS01 [Anthostomella pinea]